MFGKIKTSAALLLASLSVVGFVAPPAQATDTAWYATVGTAGTQVVYGVPSCLGNNSYYGTDYARWLSVAPSCRFGKVDVTAYRNGTNVWTTTQVWVRKDYRYAWATVNDTAHTFRTHCYDSPWLCGTPTVWYQTDAGGTIVFHDTTEVWFSAYPGYEYWLRTTAWVFENNGWVGKNLDFKIDAGGVITNQTK